MSVFSWWFLGCLDFSWGFLGAVRRFLGVDSVSAVFLGGC